MADELRGRVVAILAADGVEQIELEQPRQAVEQAGARTELLSIKPGEIQAANHDIHLADRFPVDRQVSQVSIDDYDALILPGGTTNPDICARTRQQCASCATSSWPASPWG